MSVHIDFPGQPEGPLRGQLQGLYAYLHRTAQQLQWAFDTLEETREEAPVSGREPSKKEGASPQETFGQIKNLIIKSADIVEAYEEKIKKTLEGTYVAQSDFGTYREQVRQELSLDAQRLQQLFTYQSSLSQDLQKLEAETRGAQAYIRTGKLAESGGLPVYGLEIGQQTQVGGKPVFRKYARFTADRLSFFDGSDVEVAYISDYRLYIGNAQVGGTLDLGSRFRVLSDKGLIFKYLGGGG